MARGKKNTPEQVVSLLRQVEVAVASGETTPQACKEFLIAEQTYYRWRKGFPINPPHLLAVDRNLLARQQHLQVPIAKLWKFPGQFQQRSHNQPSALRFS